MNPWLFMSVQYPVLVILHSPVQPSAFPFEHSDFDPAPIDPAAAGPANPPPPIPIPQLPDVPDVPPPPQPAPMSSGGPPPVQITDEFPAFVTHAHRTELADRINSLRLQSQGDSAFRKKSYDAAIANYQLAMDAAPDRRVTCYRMTLAQIAAGEFATAATWLKTAALLPTEDGESGLKPSDLYGANAGEEIRTHGLKLWNWLAEKPGSADRLLLAAYFQNFRGFSAAARELTELAAKQGAAEDTISAVLDATAPHLTSSPPALPASEARIDRKDQRSGPREASENASGLQTDDTQNRVIDQVSEPQTITFEHVYGPEKIAVGSNSPKQIIWIDDDHYVQREASEWSLVTAESGAAEPWYDRRQLADALRSIGSIPEENLEKMVNGEWIGLLPEKRIAAFRHGSTLIRLTLDGTRLSQVSGLPEHTELMTLSPTGDAVAFVAQNELWVCDFESQMVRQLTNDRIPGVRNGKADWVYFEEVYNRHWKAYQWSPDGRHIAFQQFDDRHVPVFQVAAHTTVQQQIETEHYPKAGDPNPRVQLGITSLNGGATQWIDTSEYPAEDLLLVHFNWFPDSQGIYWFAQNRTQTWLDVWFTRTQGNTVHHKLLRDQTPAWVDNPGDLRFLSDGSCLFFSERTGWRHLYRITESGEVSPVTTGEWEVRDLLAVAADESAVYVSATRDSRIAENLYRVSLKPSSAVTRVTSGEGQHQVSCSPHARYFTDLRSSLNQPPQMTLNTHDGREIRVLSPAAQVPSDKYRFGSVEFRDVPMADGSTTRAIAVFPPEFDPHVKHPVWLRSYGGPHSPGVRDAWNLRLQDHLLANQGIVTITFDPRSASGYGARSAWIAWHKLGVEETRDLISVCDWLTQQPWADSTKIGLSGHSYGGYFTAYAMTHCDRISAGIAGAPVTDWANYDTIYTERYMSTPQRNPEGYRNSSVIESASNLKGRLLLLHGLQDDNVHPENTIQLIHGLQQAEQSFEVMFYPTARHAISGEHYNRMMFNFIVKAMGKSHAQVP